LFQTDVSYSPDSPKIKATVTEHLPRYDQFVPQVYKKFQDEKEAVEQLFQPSPLSSTSIYRFADASDNADIGNPL
jgi:hypothetical protein